MIVHGNVHGPRAYAHRAHSRPVHARARTPEGLQPVAGSPPGRLTPYADASGALGWQITTTREKGQRHKRIPHPDITVTVISTGPNALLCRADDYPDAGVLILDYAAWPATAALRSALTALPAHGRLSVRAVLATTRMGRIIRYLIPEFTTTKNPVA